MKFIIERIPPIEVKWWRVIEDGKAVFVGTLEECEEYNKAYRLVPTKLLKANRE